MDAKSTIIKLKKNYNEKSTLSRISTQEKYDLLDFEQNLEGIGKKPLLISVFILLLILLILIPKVYLSNNIYYFSRDISKLQNQKEILSEEKRGLQKDLDEIRVKHIFDNIGG